MAIPNPNSATPPDAQTPAPTPTPGSTPGTTSGGTPGLPGSGFVPPQPNSASDAAPSAPATTHFEASAVQLPAATHFDASAAQLAAATHFDASAAQLPAAMHFDASAAQLPASFSIPADTVSSVTMSSGSGLGSAAGTSAMLPAVSVFSSESGHASAAADAGYSGLSDLPFMHAMASSETVVYSTSDDAPWVLVSDFGSDWFIV